MIEELSKIFVHIVVPSLAAITFFALAKFVRQVAPLRALVSGQQVYTFAFIAFLVFGFYLGLRPVQVLAGPHPRPMSVSTIREFLLMSVFAPSLFLAMVTLCLGSEKVHVGWIVGLFVFGFSTAVLFCMLNAVAIGGSEEIVKLGKLTAYDGLWFKNPRDDTAHIMKILFWLHLVNPGLILFTGAGVVMYHSKNYPADKALIYDNMPKKLMLLACSAYVYVATLVGGSLVYGFERVPDQWGIYHVGTLIMGIVEAISLSYPMRNEVQVSEHEE